MTLFLGCVRSDPRHGSCQVRQRMSNSFALFPWGKVSIMESEGVVFAQGINESEGIHEATSRQDNSGRYLLVSSSRLDNAQQLRRKLVPALSSFASDSLNYDHDYLILQAYSKWGEGCVNYLQGDFSFSIWDAKERVLFCARDHLGVRPFYYFKNSSGFWVSNNIQVLLAGIGISLPVCKARIMMWLQGMEGDTSLTSYENIFRLPAGHSLGLALDNHHKINRYWFLDVNASVNKGGIDENAERFSEIFQDSIKARIKTSGNIGVELSGGLDSSAVCSVSALLNRPKIRTYSAVFPSNPECDESYYIDQVVKKSGVVNCSLDAASLDNSAYFERSILAHGDCHYAGNLHIPMKIQEVAKRDGCTVLLNGVDGDNVASHGLYRLTELALLGDWRTFVREVKSVSDIYSAYYQNPGRDLFYKFGRSVLQNKSRNAMPYGVIHAVFLLSFHLGIGWTTLLKRDVLKPWLRYLCGRSDMAAFQSQGDIWHGRFSRDEFNPDLIKTTDYLDRVRLLCVSRHQYGSEREAQHALLTSGVNEHYFEYIHSTSQLNGVDTHFPFMDKRLIEFCLSLPSEQKLNDGWNRLILRRALKDVYPESIANRRGKTNLATSFDRVIVNTCSPDLNSAIKNVDDEIWGFFSIPAVKALIKNSNSTGRTRLLSHEKLWIIWCLRRWLLMKNMA